MNVSQRIINWIEESDKLVEDVRTFSEEIDRLKQHADPFRGANLAREMTSEDTKIQEHLKLWDAVERVWAKEYDLRAKFNAAYAELDRRGGSDRIRESLEEHYNALFNDPERANALKTDNDQLEEKARDFSRQTDTLATELTDYTNGGIAFSLDTSITRESDFILFGQKPLRVVSSIAKISFPNQDWKSITKKVLDAAAKASVPYFGVQGIDSTYRRFDLIEHSTGAKEEAIDAADFTPTQGLFIYAGDDAEGQSGRFVRMDISDISGTKRLTTSLTLPVGQMHQEKPYIHKFAFILDPLADSYRTG